MSVVVLRCARVCVCVCVYVCVVGLSTDAGLMITNWRQTVTKNTTESLAGSCRTPNTFPACGISVCRFLSSEYALCKGITRPVRCR